MSGNQTHGFDVVVELSEQRVGQILAALLTPHINQTFPAGRSGIRVSLDDRSVTLVRITSGGHLRLRVAFNSVRIAGVAVGGADVEIESIIDGDGASPRRIQLAFPSSPVITLREPARLDNLLVALPGSPSLPDVLGMAATAILTYLRGNVSFPPIPLGVPLGSGALALSLSDITTHTVEGALLLLLTVSGAGIPHATPPHAAAFNTSQLAGRDAVVMISNESLLAVAAAFASQPPSPIAGARFVASPDSQSLVAPIPITVQGVTFTLNAFTLRVKGDRIVMDAFVTLAWTGIALKGPISADIGFTCRPDGTIGIDFAPGQVRTALTVSVEWWVYLLSLGLAELLAPILGPLAALLFEVVIVLAAPLLSVLANFVARSALAGLGAAGTAATDAGFRMLPPQLLLLLGQLRCQAILIDDLTVSGELRPAVMPSLRLDATWQITNEQRVGSSVKETGGGLGPTRAFEEFKVARIGTFRASTTALVHPLSYSWALNQHPLSASGTISIDGVDVAYTTSGPECMISTQLGAALGADLRVRVQDSSGFALIDSTPIDKEGTESRAVSEAPPSLGVRSFMFLQHQSIPSGPHPCPAPDTAQDFRRNITLAIGAAMNVDPRVLNPQMFRD